MAVGYDIVVESVGDVRKGEWFIVVVTDKGIALRDKDGKVVTSVLYPHLRLMVFKIFEHTPFIQIRNGKSNTNLEYESLKEAKNAYRMFKMAIKNNKRGYVERYTRIVPIDFSVPYWEADCMITRVCAQLESEDFEMTFIPLKHVFVVEDWAKKKLDETFMEVRW